MSKKTTCSISNNGKLWVPAPWIVEQTERWREKLKTQDVSAAPFLAARMYDDPKFNLYISAIIDTAHQIEPDYQRQRRIVMVFVQNLREWLSETMFVDPKGRKVSLLEAPSSASGDIRRLLRKIVKELCRESWEMTA